MDALRRITDELIEAFAPLIDAAQDPEKLQVLLAALGWTPNSMPEPVRGALASGAGLLDVIRSGADPIESPEAVARVTRLAAAVNAIANSPDNAFPGGIDVASFKATIARDLLDYALVAHLLHHRSRLGDVLKLAGILRVTDTPALGARQRYLKYEVAWNRLGMLLTDPARGFREVVDWESAAPRSSSAVFDVGGLLESYNLRLSVFEAPADLLAFLNAGATAPVDSSFVLDVAFDGVMPGTASMLAGFQLVAFPPTVARSTAIGLLPYAHLGGATEVQLSDTLALTIGGGADFTRGVAILVAPGQPPDMQAGFLGGATAKPPEVRLGLTLKPTPGEPERTLLGDPGASRLAIDTLGLVVGGRLVTPTELDAFVEVRADGARLVVKPAPDEADSFLASLLGSEGISADFSFGVRLSSRSGFGFTGSAGLESSFPVHVAFGPIEFQAVTLGLKLRGQDVDVEVGATVAGKLGPLAFVVERAGFKLSARFPDPPTGNLGPLDLGFGFQPPKGVGLSIDAGPFKGGGYLFFDSDRQEYAGAVELTFAEFLSLKAIGLVTTRMPDGSRGFSLLIVITAEFEPGLQLGFGFTLIGVGGLLGLNRTVVLEALALGIRTGAVNGILFPVDVVGNAPRILSDLRTIFPPSAGRFLIGPMAKLGWGTPTIITLDLGLVIEIPGNVVILGVLRLAVAGDDGTPVLRLQVNFIGALEFDKKRAWFFAALFDSRLLTITIDGEMGMLIAVGKDANLLVSIGGFHPQFSAPALPFRTRRIGFNIIDTDNARIRVEGYFAVTSNTAQFGVRAELFFGFSGFSVEGQLQFDALMRFSPAYLLVEVTARASLKVRGFGVFSIHLDFALSGPGPWRARGHGSVSLLFVTIRKSFDESWGETITTTLPPIAVVPLFIEELAKPSNWRALTPPAHTLLVSLRTLDLPGDTLVLHPLGRLEVSQNAIPLGITFDRVGEQMPSDANRLALDVIGGALVKRRDAVRSFAPAQFRNMTDAQKLSAPAFEDQPSGVELGAAGSELRTGHAVKRSLRYEVTTIDTLFRRFVRRFSGLGAGLFGHFIGNAAVARSSLSQTQRKKLQPFADRVEVQGERHSVVSVIDNRPVAGSRDFPSEGEAREWLRQQAAIDPRLQGRLQVVPSTEKSAA
ncbi:MAG: DUF6603 domain-containing protein [Vicinamibacterales bacterium]